MRASATSHARLLLRASGMGSCQVAGIMNGTTNFMLSAMEARGVDYADILAEAQANGYAEGESPLNVSPPPPPAQH